MKKIAISLLFFGIAHLAVSQVKQNENGQYITADGSLYSGILETNKNGIKAAILQIKNGQAHGRAKYFHESGALMKDGRILFLYYANADRAHPGWPRPQVAAGVFQVPKQ